MDAGSSTEARKRKRPSARQSDSARRLPSSSPLEVSKRRRLDDNEPPQQPKSPLRVLKSAIGSIGGALGLGRTKDSSPMESQSDRENLPRRKPRKALHELYQNDVDELAPAGVKYLPATAQPKSGTRKSSGAAKEPPQEDGTPVPSSQTRLKRPRRSRGTVEPGVDNGEIEAASPTATDSIQGEADTAAAFTGRPSLQERELKLLRTELVEYEDSRETPPRSETPNISARSSGRERRRPRRYSNEMLKDVVTKPKSILTPSKGRVGRVKKTVGFGEDTSSTRMSTVEPAGSPDLDTMETDVVETPTKPKRSRTRKITSESPAESLKGVPLTPKLKGASVDLDEEVDAIKDETSAKRTKQLKRPSGKVKPTKSPSPEDVDMIDVETAAVTKEEDDDDIKCVICGGANSEPPNEIVLCDNCDLAAHQACYDVPVIPEGDWLCRDCRTGGDDEELSLIETTRLDIGGKDIPDIEELEFHLQVTQKLILDKLTGRRRLKLVGLDEEYQKVHQVVEQTVLAGEGNSMLVIGARGSGKSALVENVIDALSTDHRDDFYVVRLSGFIHTDDKLALREIWRQLGREMEIDESETSKTNNYADTLSTLLALLSHPSEMGEAEDNQTTKSIVFVLDEFDLFAYHPRQTLLYNLFDIAQARKAPIAVLGLTTKIDVVESLEKRVKSRFSHRYVHLPLSRSLAAFWEICRQGLTIDMNELVEEGYDPGVPGIDKFLSYWTSMVDVSVHTSYPSNKTTSLTLSQTDPLPQRPRLQTPPPNRLLPP